MDGDGDDGPPERASRVPIAAIPEPAARYRVRAGEPVIVATNDAFDEAFDAPPTGTTVGQWLRERAGANAATVDDACSSLADGDAVDVTVEVDASPTRDEDQSRPREQEGSREQSRAGSRYRLRARAWRQGRGQPGPRSEAQHGARGGDRDDDADNGADVDAIEGLCTLTERGPARPDRGGANLDSVASVVSHDLRNPLDVAKAHVLAAREADDATEHLDAVDRSLDRMESIVRDVLALTRGERTLDVADGVDVGAVATDAWATVDTDAASLAVADDVPAVAADADRVRRLFENLFRNSVEHARSDGAGSSDDANPVEGRSLTVRVGSTADGFFVADDGVGIDPEERDRIFDPGYSAADGSGTGLGLTIVEEIASAHDWGVAVESDPAGGARFEFRVPTSEP